METTKRTATEQLADLIPYVYIYHGRYIVSIMQGWKVCATIHDEAVFIGLSVDDCMTKIDEVENASA